MATAFCTQCGEMTVSVVVCRTQRWTVSPDRTLTEGDIGLDVVFECGQCGRLVEVEPDVEGPLTDTAMEALGTAVLLEEGSSRPGRAPTSTGARVFPVDELEGFYVGRGLCVHVTFEDDHIVAIDLFDDETAACFWGKGKVVRAVILDLKTGAVTFEGEEEAGSDE